jgi:NAD(P)-dependent dehydrogenase (short-subunit alcohol dehydrogenase family)
VAVLDQFRLDGKRALITGGSKGLGFAMAKALAEAGSDLVLVSRSEGNLTSARSKLEATRRDVLIVPADLSSSHAAEEMCRKVLGDSRPVDILINNVGGRVHDNPLVDESTEDWERAMTLNLTSAFVCTRALGRPMLERRWGRIINIGSMSGQVSTRNIGGRHYETAKAALAGLTRTVASDWAPYNVTVNAIDPGPFLTEGNRRWFVEKPLLQKQIETNIPMGRLGDPAELGGLAVFLASDASSYITGASILIDGGYTLW